MRYVNKLFDYILVKLRQQEGHKSIHMPSKYFQNGNLYGFVKKKKKRVEANWYIWEKNEKLVKINKREIHTEALLGIIILRLEIYITVNFMTVFPFFFVQNITLISYEKKRKLLLRMKKKASLLFLYKDTLLYWNNKQRKIYEDKYYA